MQKINLFATVLLGLFVSLSVQASQDTVTVFPSVKYEVANGTASLPATEFCIEDENTLRSLDPVSACVERDREFRCAEKADIFVFASRVIHVNTPCESSRCAGQDVVAKKIGPVVEGTVYERQHRRNGYGANFSEKLEDVTYTLPNCDRI